MKLFRKWTAEVPDSDRRDALQARYDQLQLKLDNAVTSIAVMEGQIRSLETEWIDTYEKYRTLYNRLAKRHEREQKAEQPEPQAAPPGEYNPIALRLLNNGWTKP